jgi:hypothetical protein
MKTAARNAKGPIALDASGQSREKPFRKMHVRIPPDGASGGRAVHAGWVTRVADDILGGAGQPAAKPGVKPADDDPDQHDFFDASYSRNERLILRLLSFPSASLG